MVYNSAIDCSCAPSYPVYTVDCQQIFKSKYYTHQVIAIDVQMSKPNAIKKFKHLYDI